ncbi:MAG: flagellar hook-basal body complex protein FliE [Gaiellales bacterium]
MAPLGGIGAGIGGGISLPMELLKGSPGTGKIAGTEGTEKTAGGQSFSDVLKNKLTSLNAEQVDASRATEDMATGRADDVAQTMLRIEQANVSLQMATQVRNKMIEAYQEVIRMQM